MPNTTATQALGRAIQAVPAERFHGADGQAVRPCTPATVTHRHLRMLDVHRGASVMDIGIGSGLSAALLAQLAGPDGHVTAVEIDPGLANRAKALYAEHGHQVTVILGDGLIGYPQNGPYDRILVGTTPPAIPDAWLQQLKPGGTLLSGVRIARLPGAYAIARIRVDDKHQPHRVELHHGGYTPMIAAAPGDTASRATGPEQPDCSLTPLNEQQRSTTESLLTALRDATHTEPTPAPAPDYFHLKNWLIATETTGLIAATTAHGTGVGLGSLSPDGTARVAIVTDEHLITDHAESPALEALRALIHQWREAGSPHTHELHASLTRHGDLWHARATTNVPPNQGGHS